jgi:hypothetical protein
LDLNALTAALGEIERAARDFVEASQSADADQRLLEALRQLNGTLNEPYGFDQNTEALRSRVWTDCMTVLSNLELAPQHAAGQQSDLVRTQVQKLLTLIGGLLDLVRERAEKR